MRVKGDSKVLGSQGGVDTVIADSDRVLGWIGMVFRMDEEELCFIVIEFEAI